MWSVILLTHSTYFLNIKIRHTGVWVFSEPRTANWRTGKTRTVREIGRWLAVTSVITWHTVRKIPMTIAPPWLSKQRTSNGELIASKSYVCKLYDFYSRLF